MVLGKLDKLRWRGLAAIGENLIEDVGTELLNTNLVVSCLGLD
jgi:hypothetical protein